VTTLDEHGAPKRLTTDAIWSVSAEPPLLLGATEQELEGGDHVMVVGLVESGRPPDPESAPILYYRRAYGSTPTAAS